MSALVVGFDDATVRLEDKRCLSRIWITFKDPSQKGIGIFGPANFKWFVLFVVLKLATCVG